MELQVPPSQRKTIKALLALDSNRLSKVISALKLIQPSMSLKDCSEIVARQANIEEQDAAAILMMLAGLFSVRERPAASGEDIVGKVLAAIEADQELTPSEE